MPIWVILLACAAIIGLMVSLLIIEPRNRAHRERDRNRRLESRGKCASHEIAIRYYGSDPIMEPIIDIVRRSIARAANIPDPNLIIPSDNLLRDLGPFGFDDIGTVELVMELESELHIKIPDRDPASFKTVDDLIKYASKKKHN